VRAVRRLAVLIAAGLLVVSPSMANACRPSVYDETRFSFPRTDFAAVLWENATYVDVAVLQRTERLPLADWVRSARARDLAVAADADDRRAVIAMYAGKEAELRHGGAAELVFRSIESLKGYGSTEFSLYGFWTRAGSPWADSFTTSADRLSPKAVWYANGRYELSPTRLTWFCTSWIGAKSNQPYLIFRDADGRLMEATIPVLDVATGETRRVQGFVDAPVELSGDPWLEAVRRVSAPSR
jgi:hypothetical protein